MVPWIRRFVTKKTREEDAEAEETWHINIEEGNQLAAFPSFAYDSSWSHLPCEFDRDA